MLQPFFFFLIFDKLNYMSFLSFQFKTHTSHYYPYLCELVCVDLKAELKAVLRKYFMRVGPVFGICNSIPQCPTPGANSGHPSISSVASGNGQQN